MPGRNLLPSRSLSTPNPSASQLWLLPNQSPLVWSRWRSPRLAGVLPCSQQTANSPRTPQVCWETCVHSLTPTWAHSHRCTHSSHSTHTLTRLPRDLPTHLLTDTHTHAHTHTPEGQVPFGEDWPLWKVLGLRRTPLRGYQRVKREHFQGVCLLINTVNSFPFTNINSWQSVTKKERGKKKP